MTTQNPLEQALHKHGDELYQTALVITLDARTASQTLVRAARALAQRPPSSLDLITLTQALVAALPPKPRTPARLPWTVERANEPLLAAFARLPMEQRLALDFLLRRDYEPAQVAPLFAHSPSQASDALRHALLALAPLVEPDLPPDLLDGANAPEACRDTRKALAVSPGALFEPAVRGHLATCSACRSAEQAWGRVRTALEAALRAALRHVEQPEGTRQQIEAIFSPTAERPSVQRLLTPQVLRIGLPVVVLLLVGLIVLPRPSQVSQTAATLGRAQSDPHQLIQRALDTLYQPSAGEGPWHGQYEIHWNFSDRLYATLIGDTWRANDPVRSRAQLVHRDGGAPYEFVLSNESSTWYANTALYGNSVYGPLRNSYPDQVRIATTPEEQQAIFQARLDAGAWGLAKTYLQQGLAAKNVSTWGRQRAVNGAEQMVLGFAGISPLGYAPDAPNATGAATTILLTIDLESGQLREIREVSGPTGGEQIGRTIWRQIVDEHLDMATIGKVFDVAQAYNGTGRFIPLDGTNGVANPALPMVPSAWVRSPADSIAHGETGLYLPNGTPPGIEQAMIIAANPYDEPIVVYTGRNRMLVVSPQTDTPNLQAFENFDNDHREVLNRDGKRVILFPGVNMRYGMQVEHPTSDKTSLIVVQVYAFGFTRADMVQIADSFALFDVDRYAANAKLFRSHQPHDPQALKLLLAMVQRTPLQLNQARKIVERRFIREGPLRDSLIDPYHRRFYLSGSRVATEIWSRRTTSGLEVVTKRRNEQGDMLNQSFESTSWRYWYDRSSNRVYVSNTAQPLEREPINEPVWTAINLLGCGGTTLKTQADGTRIITQVDSNWYAESCNRENYAEVVYAQFINNQQRFNRAPPVRINGYFNINAEPDSGPYLVDVIDQTLYHNLFIDKTGKAYRYEVRANDLFSGELIELAEIVEDTTMPLAQVPAGVFDSTPPDALFRAEEGKSNAQAGLTRFIRVNDVPASIKTPLWYLPPSPEVQLNEIGVIDPQFSWLSQSNDAFADAFNRGCAVRFSYAPPPGDRNQGSQLLYVGEEQRLGTFLRTQRAWRSSEPVQLNIGGTAYTGWQVTTLDDGIWTLVELDGTLVALDTSTPERRERLGLLQRFEQ